MEYILNLIKEVKEDVAKGIKELNQDNSNLRQEVSKEIAVLTDKVRKSK